MNAGIARVLCHPVPQSTSGWIQSRNPSSLAWHAPKFSCQVEVLILHSLFINFSKLHYSLSTPRNLNWYCFLVIMVRAKLVWHFYTAWVASLIVESKHLTGRNLRDYGLSLAHRWGYSLSWRCKSYHGYTSSTVRSKWRWMVLLSLLSPSYSVQGSSSWAGPTTSKIHLLLPHLT